MEEFQLNVIWQTSRDSINVIFTRMASFRLKEELMGCLICKFNDFVFNRWTISRSDTFNPAAVEWRPVQIRPDDFMRCRPGDDSA